MQSDHINIILVEDNDDDITMIQNLFEEASGCTIAHVAKDGEALISFMRQLENAEDAEQFDLILLDINMPKMNGFEVLDLMKSDPNLKHWPVAVLTTSDREEDMFRSYQNGACSYIIKPTDYFAFGEMVKHFADYWTRVSSIPTTKGVPP